MADKEGTKLPTIRNKVTFLIHESDGESDEETESLVKKQNEKNRYGRKSNNQESLPRADLNSRGLVANRDVLQREATNSGTRTSSLPLTRSQKLVETSARNVSSAPSKKQTSPTRALPKINNLVNSGADPNSQETHTSRGHRDGYAGKSTRDKDAQFVKSKKFASSWAHNRADISPRSQHQNKSDTKSVATSDSSQQAHAKPQGILRNNTKHDEGSKATQEIANTENGVRTRSGASTGKDVNNNVGSAHKAQSQSSQTRDTTKQPSVTVTSEKFAEHGTTKKPDGNVQTLKREFTRNKTTFTLKTKVEELPVEYQRSKSIYVAETRRLLDTSKSETRPSKKEILIRKIPPWRRSKDYVLTPNETTKYREITSVYGTQTEIHKKQRKREFFKRLSKVQMDAVIQHNKSVEKQEQMKRQTRARQQKELKRVRERFEKEQKQRFMSQYVTSRVLQVEKETRYEYGLPEDLHKVQGNQMKLKRKKSVYIPLNKFKKGVNQVKNMNRFKKMFDIHFGPSWDQKAKVPKMEGVDVVTVDEIDEHGNRKTKKLDIKSVMHEANHLATPEDETHEKDTLGLGDPEVDKLSVASLQIDDDDGTSDIFEKAMEKYGIDLDSEDDDDDDVDETRKEDPTLV
ncbi:uncharacterized protein LOC106150453 isoform X2 [Lingula anatina]|uniref:Uncharacterized protein LOC106150453 isoform X2 n=1 Tax=Lingula anatina TaxID=7574 RepID=A0A1S3GZS7_LINAN|nr:uncharacterized protein LOC106150453 isoform X2 [Lingula anatina]|eukprot:XP_013378736.1 uncharacterized protein LOC106150453 isoform X2 [Lingula anatina]